MNKKICPYCAKKLKEESRYVSLCDDYVYIKRLTCACGYYKSTREFVPKKEYEIIMKDNA
jgi:uncharacterized protein VirK/YbjX